MTTALTLELSGNILENKTSMHIKNICTRTLKVQVHAHSDSAIVHTNVMNKGTNFSTPHLVLSFKTYIVPIGVQSLLVLMFSLWILIMPTFWKPSIEIMKTKLAHSFTFKDGSLCAQHSHIPSKSYFPYRELINMRKRFMNPSAGKLYNLSKRSLPHEWSLRLKKCEKISGQILNPDQYINYHHYTLGKQWDLNHVHVTCKRLMISCG